jgi:ornithine carbamoyltransferase
MKANGIRHLISLLDYSPEEIDQLLRDAQSCKAELKSRGPSDRLKGRTVALFFEKPSLRTRVTFEVAMVQTGGAAIVLDPGSVSLGRRESVHDAAKNLSRWVDGIVARTFSHRLVEELAVHADVPVINALTDRHHPCQALAFGQTLLEHFGDLKGRHVAFIGDGNNVANSLAELAALSGMHFTLAAPEGFEQPKDVLKSLEEPFRQHGGSYQLVRDPREAAKKADVIYTDVWVSMGEEAQASEKKQQFQRYQVNAELMALAPSHCKFTHCLPAHIGEEVTQEVMDSPANICFDEAENRLHSQKAVLIRLLEKHNG